MRLRLCEGRPAISERVVSVESDSETLGRAGCGREKASSRCEIGSFVGDYRFPYCIRAYADKLLYGEIKSCAGASALTRAVTTACGGPVMRPARMVATCMVSRSHTAGAIRTCCLAGPMHRAGYDGNRGTAQRSDPRREQNDDELDGEQSAHHGCQSTLRAKCPSGTPSRGESEIQCSARSPQTA